MKCKIVIDRDMVEEPDLALLGCSEYETLSLEEGKKLALGAQERVIYLLSLRNGGLRYQVEFIRENQEVAQWVIMAFADNPRTVAGFRGLLGKLEASVHIVQVENGNMEKAMPMFSAIPLIRPQTCLIYSRRSHTGKRTAAALLKEDCPDWEFQICEGEDAVLKDECQKMRKVLLMGRSIQDFAIEKPDCLNTEPILLYNRADENLQNCMDRNCLWKQIRSSLRKKKWELPEDYPYFLVGSLRYEKWKRQAQKGFGESLQLEEEFVMWDESGLPCLRESYTEEAIDKFLSQFDVVKRIGSDLKRK